MNDSEIAHCIMRQLGAASMEEALVLVTSLQCDLEDASSALGILTESLDLYRKHLYTCE